VTEPRLNQRDVQPTVDECPMAQVPARLLHAETMATGDPTATWRSGRTEDSARAPNQQWRCRPTTTAARWMPITAASTARHLVAMLLMGTFGGASVLLAAIRRFRPGWRTPSAAAREFGIRLALGAQPTNVRNVVLADGLWLAICGHAHRALRSLRELSQNLRFSVGVTQSRPPVVLVATTRDLFSRPLFS